MKIGILDVPQAFSGYIRELLQTWGMAFHDLLVPEDLAALEPDRIAAVIVPALKNGDSLVPSLRRYCEKGGLALLIRPEGELAALAGLRELGLRRGHLRLRRSGLANAALPMEGLPIVGRAGAYLAEENIETLGCLYDPLLEDGDRSDSPAIARRVMGQGAAVALCFDLPRCVMLLRQGDPANAEYIPSAGPPEGRFAKASNLAADIGPRDCGFIPFADCLGRLLTAVLRQSLPAPLPVLWHLPASATALVLFSGDEDAAPPEAVREELNLVADAGGRMNLYIIPRMTQTTAADVEQYARRHDIGPHPNIIPVIREPISRRVAEYRDQIEYFKTLFGVRPRSIRNHIAGWAGYLDLVRVQQECGIRMDANYFSGHYCRQRDHAPFSPFGAAMPMRFCEADGRLLEVFQQHTQLHDDILLAPRLYSFRFSLEVFEEYIGRVLDDLQSRFQMPLTVNFHPGNWVKFSRAGGLSVLRMARQRNVPVWSLDQWLSFWETRDHVRLNSLKWDGRWMRCHLEEQYRPEGLCLALPRRHHEAQLEEVLVGGRSLPVNTRSSLPRDVALIPLPAGAERVSVEARYTSCAC